MDDMTVTKTDMPSKLLGADLSRSFPGVLFSPSNRQGKPAPIPHPPNKPLSLLSKTDDDLQPLSWLVSPNLLHNVCGRPVSSKPPPAPRVNSRAASSNSKFLSMTSSFKLKPSFDGVRHLVPTKKIRAVKIHGRFIKQEPGSPQQSQRTASPRTHPYKLPNKCQRKFARPPYSFATLIFMAVEESPTKKVTVKDIYDWILNKYPYYQLCDRRWKNTVRQNLSNNRCFKKINKDRRLECGKGSWWMIDPELRPELLQAFKKLGNVNMIPGPIGSENITPPTSPLFHTPPSSPTTHFPTSSNKTDEEKAAAALCLMKRKAGRSVMVDKTTADQETPSNSSPSTSESSPEQGSMVAIGKPPYKLPPTMKRSVMIDKKSAEGVWALLGLANSQPKTK